MLMGKLYTNALMFGLNDVGWCLMQCMYVCENKVSQVLCQGWLWEAVNF